MLIGVDHGNKQIKTVHGEPFVSGLQQSLTRPFGQSLQYCGTYYTLSNAKVKNMPSSAVAGFCFFSGIIAIAVFFLCGGSVPKQDFTWHNGMIILLLGLGPMGLSFYSWDYAIRHGDPRLIGTLTYLTPLLSICMMAFFFPGVRLTWSHLTALCMIISGVFLGKWFK